MTSSRDDLAEGPQRDLVADLRARQGQLIHYLVTHSGLEAKDLVKLKGKIVAYNEAISIIEEPEEYAMDHEERPRFEAFATTNQEIVDALTDDEDDEDDEPVVGPGVH